MACVAEWDSRTGLGVAQDVGVKDDGTLRFIAYHDRKAG